MSADFSSVTSSAALLVRTRERLTEELSVLRRADRSLGLVPTMGAFHAGHLSLVDRAREMCDETVVSVFVNRLQFAQGEDFTAYPRNLQRDLALSDDRGVRLVFAPDDQVMYPMGEPRIRVDPGTMGQRLCGPFRPGHFQGVLTVVAKLFGLIRPELAVFGRKDFQQAVLIRRMVDDLDLNVRIEVAPLVRDADGLALSSRNVYLTADERRDAVGLWRGLSSAVDRFNAGETHAGELLSTVRNVVSEYPRLRLQYAEAVDPDTLDSVSEAREGTVIAVAAFCGSTRLIDNIELGQERSDPRVESTDLAESRG